MLYYFAYGSNLHPLRLAARIASARLFGTTSIPGYRLLFHKRGADGSAKCNLYHTAAELDHVYGAIYTIDPADKCTLDQIEGKGYCNQIIYLTYQGQHYKCFTYIAEPHYIDNSLQPYHWYKELVILGARFLDIPQTYISEFEKLTSIDDPDQKRRDTHVSLIKKIASLNK